MSDTRSRLLLEVERDRYLAVEAQDVFSLEARGDDTLVRTRGKRPKGSVESLGTLAKVLPPGFFRIHRSFVVNLDRVRELRRQADGEGWEVKIEPPVNAVLPVARGRVKRLFTALGRPS